MQSRSIVRSCWLIISTCLIALIVNAQPGQARHYGDRAQQLMPSSTTAGWDPRFGELGLRRDGQWVSAFTVNDQGNVFAAGYFQWAGTQAAPGIAYWDGADWQPIANSGITGNYARITVLAAHGTDLYVGGYFTTIDGVTVNHLAKWDGQRWSALGGGVNGDSGTHIEALAFRGNEIYVGGIFTHAGGIPANNIAKWDGTRWSALGTGTSGGGTPNVQSLAFNGNDLYAGGSFTHAGSMAVNHIAKWNGTAWSALKGGVLGGIGYVFDIVIDGGNVYIGGDFTSAGGKTAHHVARWDGSDWFALPGSMPARVEDLAVVAGQVYIVNVQRGHEIRTWTGSDWVVSHTTRAGGVSDLIGVQNKLYVAGDFNQADTTRANGIAQWDGTQWHTFGQGIGSWGAAWTLRGNQQGIAIANGFNAAGDLWNSTTAHWNGENWSSLGSDVEVVMPGEHGIYAIKQVQLPESRRGVVVVKWNGTAWSAITSALWGYYTDPVVFVILERGTDLYVGGSFEYAGDVAANNIVKWNGTAWSALGAGIEGVPEDMLFIGDDLYVGGWFGRAGDVDAQNIARWNGSQWSALGNGVDSEVLDLDAVGSTLYVAGYFWTSGNQLFTPGIAQWKDGQWSALGIGIETGGDTYVHAVTADPATGTVYIGGSFDEVLDGTIDEPRIIKARNIAAWDGTRWQPLGEGVNGTVTGMAMLQGSLYLTGRFTEAGGLPSYGFARWAGQHTTFIPLAGSRS